MKKYDIVELISEKYYANHNLKQQTIGIILEKNNQTIKIMFFNPKNNGDYLVLDVQENDVRLLDHFDEGFLKQYNINLKLLAERAKNFFYPSKLKLFDKVKLLKEDKRYSKYGIHKGEIGFVVDDNAIKNFIEVDFLNFDESISVNINDLEVIN